MSSQDLSGKIALVTGASRGIGAAIADTLAQAGATVIGTATGGSGAAAIGERLAQWNGQGRALNAAEADGIENLITDIEKEFGKLDILVNNAGITRDNLLMRMKEEEWDEIMQVNLKSVFRASKAVLRGMMKQRHPHHVRGGRDGQRGAGQLRRRESRPDGFCQIHGARSGQPRHYSQLHRPGIYRHRHDPRPAGRSPQNL